MRFDRTAFEFDGKDITWFDVVFWTVSGVVCVSPFIVLSIVALIIA